MTLAWGRIHRQAASEAKQPQGLAHPPLGQTQHPGHQTVKLLLIIYSKLGWFNWPFVKLESWAHRGVVGWRKSSEEVHWEHVNNLREEHDLKYSFIAVGIGTSNNCYFADDTSITRINLNPPQDRQARWAPLCSGWHTPPSPAARLASPPSTSGRKGDRRRSRRGRSIVGSSGSKAPHALLDLLLSTGVAWPTPCSDWCWTWKK